MKENITVMLVDDETLVRVALKALLGQQPDITVVGESANGASALKMVRKLKPRIVLMDIRMPGIDGLETTRRLLRLFPEVRVIALSCCDGDPYAAQFIQSDAAGFLDKDCSSKELLHAIRVVNSGKRYVSEKILQHISIRHLSL